MGRAARFAEDEPAGVVTWRPIVGEAKADEEREVIAGVYRNRLRIGMALQADPTVQYAISVKRGRRKPRLFQKDYQIKSPYNTYLNPGLPPGPVNSPGRRSLEAALYPADVQYLYFVAAKDGRHVLLDLWQHLRAIRAEERAVSTALTYARAANRVVPPENADTPHSLPHAAIRSERPRPEATTAMHGCVVVQPAMKPRAESGWRPASSRCSPGPFTVIGARLSASASLPTRP